MEYVVNVAKASDIVREAIEVQEPCQDGPVAENHIFYGEGCELCDSHGDRSTRSRFSELLLLQAFEQDIERCGHSVLTSHLRVFQRPLQWRYSPNLCPQELHLF